VNEDEYIITTIEVCRSDWRLSRGWSWYSI